MSYDEVFDALADQQRRQLMIGLTRREIYLVAPLSGVSQDLADAHEGLLRAHLTSSRELSSVDESLLRMHCVHLPKLAAYEFVEWDRTDNLVTRGERFDDVEPVLELLDDQRREHSVTDPLAPVR